MFKWLLNLFKKKKTKVAEEALVKQTEIAKIGSKTSDKVEVVEIPTENEKTQDEFVLTLKRVYLGKTYTIGKLYLQDEYFCDTLEDVVRKGKKVYGETAIPYGTYDFILTYSPKFKKVLPLVLDVPNFENIRLHSGNEATDSLGCILCGENKIKGKLINSKITIEKLMDILQNEENKSKHFKIIIK